MTLISPETRHHLIDEAVKLEREAHQFTQDKQIDRAFETYKRAAHIFEKAGEHYKSAVCYAAAATCWNVRVGRQPLHNAAECSELAAISALRAKNYSYARLHFREAAMFYEQEGNYEKFARCYLQNKAADRLHNSELMAHPETGLRERGLAALRWLINMAGAILWGHGELPHRTFLCALALIAVMSVIYWSSGLITLTGSSVAPAGFLESLYFSVITFSTVGYGDYLPLGWVRFFASIEALSGIILAPLFLISLQRRYLRIHR